MTLPTLFQMRFLRKKTEAKPDAGLEHMRERMRERLPESGSLAELFSALAEEDQWDVERPPQIGNPGRSDGPLPGSPNRPA